MSDLNIEKTVYFVRHGQSEANVAPIIQPPDSPLTEKGRKQADHIAERVSKLKFEALIVSPALRAKETAEAIAKVTGKVPEYSDLFVERIKPVSINGKSYEDKQAVKIWGEWSRSLYTPGMKVEDGENFDEITVRVDKALAFLKDRAEQSFVVVTHGYFLRAIIAQILLGDSLSGESFKRFHEMMSMENTGLTVIRYHEIFEQEPRWRLWIYNDHAHLG